jgi:FKBP-type peptidyl-prolyl cis-trans isomerase
MKRERNAWLIVASVILMFLTACQTYSEEDKKGFDAKISHYLSKKGITNYTQTESGLYYVIKDTGAGEWLRYTDSVSFTYKAWLLNGKMVDNQKDTLTFPMRKLIGAWKEVMLELKPGAHVFFVAPPQLCYGEHKLTDIPQHSVLVFDMHIHGVK